jgi:hypothetical protein
MIDGWMIEIPPLRSVIAACCAATMTLLRSE